MILRIVRLPVKPEKTPDFLNHFYRIKSRIETFDGCLSLHLLTELHQPYIFFTVSCWQSEHHLNRYLDSDFFRETWQCVKPLFSDKAQAWSLEPATLCAPPFH
jgi:heme-degrading monooxygenase HmoA